MLKDRSRDPMDAESGWINVSEVLESGVYMLVYRGSVVYVGKAKMMLSRLAFHLDQKGKPGARRAFNTTTGKRYVSHIPFDDVWLKPMPIGEMGAEEIAMIKKYQPRYNMKHNMDTKTEAAKVQNLLLPKENWIVNLVLNREPGAHPYIVGKINRRI
jgi:excinuclease UvrABC nuclease subunit